MTDENRLVENVTQWAKRELCWQNAQKLDIGLLPEFIAELANKDDEKELQKEARSDDKLIERISSSIEIYNIGIDTWNNLLDWNATRNILTPKEIDFVKLAIAMLEGRKTPSDKQCDMIMKTLDRAKLEAFSV